MKCLIIAAGKGSRLQAKGDTKPLIPILGIPLIERAIRSSRRAGVDEFFVVTGYHSDRICSFLNDLSDRSGIPITCIVNEAWEKENGLSVLRARECLREPFLMTMADHLFDPAIARKLLDLRVADGEIALGVDRNTHNPLIDLDDVTRVKTVGSRIENIGKSLTDYNGFDTGIFLSTPAIFGALERCAEESGDTSLSGALRILAAEGRAKAVDVSGHFWIDVDDPKSFTRGEHALLANLEDKPVTVLSRGT